MFNRVFHIKGSCEECGFAYKGEVPNSDGAHPAIRCPNCGLQTKNFEDDEGVQLDYAGSKLEVISE